MTGISGGIYRISIWVMRLSLTNLCWLLFTLMGLVIFGIFPATTAMFAIVNKWREKEYEFSIFKTFWKIYKSLFLKSNLVGFFLTTIGLFLFYDFKILAAYDYITFRFIEVFLIGVTTFYILTVIYIFPVMIHYQADVFASIKNAFIVGILSPLTSISIILSSIVIIYISLALPSLFLFFTGSTLSFVHIFFTSREFRKIDQMSQQ